MDLQAWRLEEIQQQLQHFMNTAFNADYQKNSIAQFIIASPVFPYLFVAHAIYVATKVRPLLQNQYWFFSLVVTAISTVAGGTIASYMVCEIPPWMRSNQSIPIIIAIWYLVNHSPGDVFHTIITTTPFQLVLVVLENINRSRSIIHGVELGVKHAPSAFIAPILLGTISGMGTTLVTNFLVKITDDVQAPSEFSKPTFSSKSAFILCTFYYIVTDPQSLFFVRPLLVEDVAKLSISLYLVLHAVTVLAVGPFTPFPISVLERLFFLISRIPSSDDFISVPKFITSDQLDEISKKKRKEKKK